MKVTVVFLVTLWAIIKWILPVVPIPGTIAQKERAIGYGITGATLFCALNFGLGVVLKNLARSPYDQSPLGMVTNLAQTFIPLIAREGIRAYLLGWIWRKMPAIKVRRMIMAAFLTVLLAALEINWGKWSTLKGGEAIFVFFAKDVIPVCLKSVLMTILTFFGGARASVFYGGGIQVFQRLFPFLPQNSWLAESVIGIAFPAIYSFLVLEGCERKKGSYREPQDRTTAGYVASLVVSVACCWFCVGVFPVYPSVILTGSMEPQIMPGDVVMIHKIQKEQEIYKLQEGQIINFKRENITITHRIVEVIYDQAGNVSFRTKGDNNSSEDARIVMPNEVNGTVDTVVPKVGMGVLLLKKSEPIPTGVMEES